MKKKTSITISVIELRVREFIQSIKVQVAVDYV